MRETKSTKEMNGAELLELVSNEYAPTEAEVIQITALYDEMRIAVLGKGVPHNIYDILTRVYLLGKINGKKNK